MYQSNYSLIISNYDQNPLLIHSITVSYFGLKANNWKIKTYVVHAQEVADKETMSSLVTEIYLCS